MGEVAPQQFDEHPVAARPQLDRIHGRQSPVLALRGEGVRRAPAVGIQGQDVLIHPGIAPIPVASEGEVVVEPHGHAQGPGACGRRLQLLGGHPLQVLMEPDAFPMHDTKRSHVRGAG